MSTSILVVDDERAIQDTLAWCLRTDGHEVRTAGSGEEALAIMADQGFDLIISDIIMPGLSGVDLLRKARALQPRTPVVLITAFATVETAVEALREGASDYVMKPLKFDDLRHRVQGLLGHRPAFRESALPHHSVECGVPDRGLLGGSAAMLAVRAQVAKIGPAASNVLITGESGTGKELVARAIHAASPRRGQPFVPINCGAIPESLLESELFGHMKGAFTSAVQASPGLFAAADPGTVFLDEIGEMPVHMQVKLLRVIEEKQVWAVGSTKPLRIDIRVIASTNRDLDKEVEAGRFRGDLFYRLNVVHIALPPLREHREDIPLLADHFIREFNLKLGRQVQGIDRDALRALIAYPWKGNVRELEHVIESAMILSDCEILTVGDLPRCVVGESVPRNDSLRELNRQSERGHIMTVLAQTQFDKREAARILGISLASLYRKLGERRISAPPLQN
ncbi:MAG: sigma-54-dependent Fis family transcriptional regulator [Betaproteobacteria bacterium]|nr:MAG: sigma-54-dependent Fis family transcriptional regulator [Betaproteobacteria bacterium]